MESFENMTDEQIAEAFIDIEEYHRFPGTPIVICAMLLRDGTVVSGEGAIQVGAADEVGRDAARNAALGKIDLIHARATLLNAGSN